MNQSENNPLNGLWSEAQQAELGELDDLARQLGLVEAPEPAPATTERLIAAVEMARRPSSTAPAHGLSGLARLALAQLGVLDKGVFLSAALVLLLGLLVASQTNTGGLALTVVLAAPALAAVGVALAFRPATSTLAELERTAPVHPLALLYTRLALALALNTLLALALFGMVWIDQPQLALGRLLLAWLGPMLALSGLALYTTVRWGAAVGAAAPLLAWGVFTLTSWRLLDWMSIEQALAQLLSSPLLAGLALAGLAAGLALLGITGRYYERRIPA